MVKKRFHNARLLITPALMIALALVFGASLIMSARLSVAATPKTTTSRSLADASQKGDTKVAAPELDRETEAMAADLVKSHLPNLQVVLDRLRKDQPRQYERAVRDLARSAKKLEVIRNRDEQLYGLELELLKSQSDVNLLTAKLKVRDNQADRRLLREAVARLQQSSIARGEYEVRMLEQRLERTKQQLAAANERLEVKRNDFDGQLEASFLSLLGKAGRDPKADQAADKKVSAKSKQK